MIECSECGWRHIVPCGRDVCPYDAATHYATIAAALDNAVANGCMAELAKMSAEDIAYDLARHDAGCERLPIDVLKAGVRAWLSPQPDDRTARLAAIERALLHPRFYDGDIGADIRWLLAENRQFVQRQQALRGQIEALPRLAVKVGGGMVEFDRGEFLYREHVLAALAAAGASKP